MTIRDKEIYIAEASLSKCRKAVGLPHQVMRGEILYGISSPVLILRRTTRRNMLTSPPGQRKMLAPRLALQCKGTAWHQVRSIDPEKLTDAEGYKVLLKALSSWEESAELQTYDAFEKAVYRITQKADETVMSFVNRINVAFAEVGPDLTQVKAFIMLRQSSMGIEDKKRIISMSDGYDPTRIEKAMRTLTTKILGQADPGKKRVYPAAFVDDETEDGFYLMDDDWDEESGLAALLEEGDESALVVSEFEDHIIQICQENSDLSMAFSAYQEARAKIRDKLRSRGFWPPRGSGGKGKGKLKKGKGMFGRRRQSLADRIASSACRACGQKGHWKDECPNKGANPGAEDHVTIVENEPEEELLENLPADLTVQHQAGSAPHPPVGMPPEYSNVNDEFSQSSFDSQEIVLHVDILKKYPQVLKNFKSNFRKAVEQSFSVTRSQPNGCEGVDELGSKGTGIIDTGASKSVIGEKRVSALLATLSRHHRDRIKWRMSATVFRFGNNQTLQSLGALFLPFGGKWLKIEVVQGLTPFLISNVFLSAIEADIISSRSCLHVSKWGHDIPLSRNSKGLFIVALKDLLTAADEFGQLREVEEVITMVTAKGNRYLSSEVSSKQQQQHVGKSSAPAEVAQPQTLDKCNVPASSYSLRGEHGGAQEPELSIGQYVQDDLCPPCGPVPGGTGRSKHGLCASSGTPVHHPPSDRSDHTVTVGTDDLPRREVSRGHLREDLCGPAGIRQTDEEQRSADLKLGTELQGVCHRSSKCRSRVRGTPEEDGERHGGSCETDDCHSTLEEARSRMGSGDRVTSRSTLESKYISEASGVGLGGTLNGDRLRAPGDEREHDSTGNLAERDGQDQSRDEQKVSGTPGESDVLSQTASIFAQIEEVQSVISRDLDRMKKLWDNSKTQCAGSLKRGTSWGLDLLEIYCEPDSELTNQALRLGLKARRFTIQDGDLATESGCQSLWKILREERPRHVWVAPECKCWGNFSRWNMSRSSSTANKILQGREREKIHLRLCRDVYWHQIGVGGQFHLEQPQGSEAIYQRELRDVFEGTLCTTVDMCEVGKLMAPRIKNAKGNSFLRKRTTVFTSSKVFHTAFDCRLCSGAHRHTPIIGKVWHLGKWISLSEFAARYSSGFGKNVARYVGSRLNEVPLVWDELCVGDVTREFAGAMVNRKRENVSEDASEGLESNPKRIRHTYKHPAVGDHQCATPAYWDKVFKQVESQVPRVGKRVMVDGAEFDAVSKGIFGFKVRRVEACRGTERLRLPEKDADPSSVPLRVTIVQNRQSGTSEVLGPAEEWSQLPKYQQIRKGKPAKISLTVFGEPFSGEDETSSVEQPRADSDEPKPEKEPPKVDDSGDGLVGRGRPKNVARHGPGFLSLNAEEKAQIRRLHHNLGHPKTELLVRFLKERHVEPHILQGAMDFQCDSCTESQKGFEPVRPAAIHRDIGFNEVVGMDTATWTNHVGQQFMFAHVIDEGTLFHLGAPVSSCDAESMVRVFERTWMLWAGPPQTIYVDPATEYKAELWQDRMQSLDIQVKMSVSDAHWQLGRVEVHGSTIKRMLQRMDLEKPIRTPQEFEEALTQAFNAKNSLSRIKGFTPEQAVLGVSRKLPGSVTSSKGAGSLTLADSPGPVSDQFRESLALRSRARKAFIDADNSSSLRRALLRRSRPLRGPYEVGDWVLYWRRKGANMKREHGRWYGPACIVATKGLKSVWMNHSGKLVRACPEQIRPASFREWHAVQKSALEADKIDGESLRGVKGDFLDLDGEEIPSGDSEYTPSLLEPEGEETVSEQGPPSLEPDEHDSPTVDDGVEVPVSDTPFSEDASEPGESEAVRSGEEGEPLLFGDDLECQGDPHAALQIWELSFPIEPNREAEIASAESPDASVMLTTDAKKKRVEVKLSELSGREQFLMAVAKHKEIGAWLKHSTVRKVARGKIPERSIMRCRWILSWKSASPDGDSRDVISGKKAKARLVVVRFEDPGVGVVQNDSPTLTKDGRQVVLQQVSSHQWELLSFDVSTAFLHGDGDGRLLGIHPPSELSEALGMTPDSQCELVGGAYGRVDAPYLWFRKFQKSLSAEGFTQRPMDPCVFTLTSTDEAGRTVVNGSLGIHVDDGIGGGDEKFLAALERLQKRFKFGSFEKRDFVFTGIRFRQWDDFSIE